LIWVTHLASTGVAVLHQAAARNTSRTQLWLYAPPGSTARQHRPAAPPGSTAQHILILVALARGGAGAAASAADVSCHSARP
jgi:hypothetical protein